MTVFKLSADRDLPKRFILSISSDFGIALAEAWLNRGIGVAGTYRTDSAACARLRDKGAKLIRCDLSDTASLNSAVSDLKRLWDWDVLVIAPATQEPIGPFIDISFKEWEKSLHVNFTSHLHLLHDLLPSRRTASERGPIALFFAGGGTNNATVNYSAYTISKIASIKVVELLDAEITDTRFSILGPGWVKTKIHQASLDARDRAGTNYERTVRMLESENTVPLDRVVACCDWLIGAPRQIVGGRNFSLVHDCWGEPKLDELLKEDANMYKLRRAGNDRLVRAKTLA
jgi:NAD(P)-dependent dehydrogenase (short-subunit alcohol dehydrogenase family)